MSTERDLSDESDSEGETERDLSDESDSEGECDGAKQAYAQVPKGIGLR